MVTTETGIEYYTTRELAELYPHRLRHPYNAWADELSHWRTLRLLEPGRDFHRIEERYGKPIFVYLHLRILVILWENPAVPFCQRVLAEHSTTIREVLQGVGREVG